MRGFAIVRDTYNEDDCKSSYDVIAVYTDYQKALGHYNSLIEVYRNDDKRFFEDVNEEWPFEELVYEEEPWSECMSFHSSDGEKFYTLALVRTNIEF
ncbi:MAG: hypothetical protein UD103_02940 [Bacteroidales bacterium]|nr:hypothetical protein [Bacteroidales bacterium]